MTNFWPKFGVVLYNFLGDFFANIGIDSSRRQRIERKNGQHARDSNKNAFISNAEAISHTFSASYYSTNGCVLVKHSRERILWYLQEEYFQRHEFS